MADYVTVFQYENKVGLILQAAAGPVFSLGQKLEAVCPEAYMNGYNWDALFRYYLEKNNPDILIGMDTDPEADMYEAHWSLSPESEARAKRFEAIIRSLVEQEEELCRIVREEGSAIEWD